MLISFKKNDIIRKQNQRGVCRKKATNISENAYVCGDPQKIGRAFQLVREQPYWRGIRLEAEEQRLINMLRLLWERREQQQEGGQSSGTERDYQPWLEMLPSPCALVTDPASPPLFWTEDEREALRGTPLHRATGKNFCSGPSR